MAYREEKTVWNEVNNRGTKLWTMMNDNSKASKHRARFVQEHGGFFTQEGRYWVWTNPVKEHNGYWLKRVGTEEKVFFESMTEFGEKHGLTPVKICELLNGKRKTYKGWTAVEIRAVKEGVGSHENLEIKINKKIIPVKKNENLSKLVDKTNIKDLDIKYKKSIEDIKKANDLGYKSVDNIVKDSNKNCNCEEVSKKSIYNFLKERRLIDKRGLLHYADDYFADMGYSDIRWENYISPKQGGNGVYNTFDMHKYNILNTDRWAPPSRFHADCKTDNPNIISPVATSGYPVNLLEFDESRKILPRDKINIEYIKDRLNS